MTMCWYHKDFEKLYRIIDIKIIIYINLNEKKYN